MTISTTAPYMNHGDHANPLSTRDPQNLRRLSITPTAPYLALLRDIDNAGAHGDEMLAFLNRHDAYRSTWPETPSVLRDLEMDIAPRQENDPSLASFLFSHVPASRAADVFKSLNGFYRTGEGWDVEAHNAAHRRDVA
ncbi:MAG: hypothetical protein LQ340_001690 [Diploschistes diacapsis]|nr:MAG: hypothetical protein LQ340_001690 [Diploschistes diacapsis]